MKKKNILIGITALAVLGGGAYYLVPSIQESNVVNSETIKAEKFEELSDVELEILDTSAFADTNLEKWYESNKDKNGEHLYYDNEYTHILVSGGDKTNDNDIIWLEGVKKSGNALVIGYEFVDGEEFGVKKETKESPTLLVRTKGEYKEAKGIVVEKKEAEPVVESEVTTEDSDEDVTEVDVNEESNTESDESTSEKEEGIDEDTSDDK